MASITLTVLEGLERGRVYSDLETPITIGREDDNDIQLNDERVSRVHAKIQEDRGQIILTDVNSTNGSRVNGHPIHLRVLRPGDHVQIGRCILLFGSEEQIAQRAAAMGLQVRDLLPLSDNAADHSANDSDPEFELEQEVTADNLQLPLFPDGSPALPEGLDAGQRARLSDVLSYLHERLREIAVIAAEADHDASELPEFNVPWPTWQRVLLMQKDLAEYLREVAGE